MKLIDRYSLLVTGEVSFIFVKPFLFSRKRMTVLRVTLVVFDE